MPLSLHVPTLSLSQNPGILRGPGDSIHRAMRHSREEQSSDTQTLSEAEHAAQAGVWLSGGLACSLSFQQTNSKRGSGTKSWQFRINMVHICSRILCEVGRDSGEPVSQTDSTFV